MKTTTTKMMMKTMKTMLISLFALLLLAVQAQAQRQPLAVLVVGVDNWMFGDVLAHIVGEELKRGNSNLVSVTREKFVQNKLKALRRATGWINCCELREWANAQGLAQVCLVEAKKGVGGNANAPFSFANAEQKYSAQVIDVAGNRSSCAAAFDFKRSGGGEMAPAELTRVAWEVVGRLQSSGCQVAERIKCFAGEPTMVFVPGGWYEMGLNDKRGMLSNKQRTVGVSDFWIGKYEVTQAEWYAVMGSYTSTFNKKAGAKHKGADKPMVYVSYDDITKPTTGFLAKLNEKAGITDAAKKYRLPTEAEWEYAASGGSVTPKFCSGGCDYSGSDSLSAVGWYKDNSGDAPHPIGQLAANELGIYDMSGNVSEWCSTWFSDDLPADNSFNPPGPATGTSRLLRGGNWLCDGDWDYYPLSHCRVDVRFAHYPDDGNYAYGIRVVLP
ncbi:MAG: formylglycine-generating enzyme family protein [Prevotellaceae bacterium]|jgi:formylglycine-generating enzyme required for sulfatase activity|nr:formylglycine-generating enzyme family protein [Prevotellaceae bacterium]